jgi:hypothetical protein
MYLNLRKMPKTFLPHQKMIPGPYKPYTLKQALLPNPKKMPNLRLPRKT